MKYTRPELEWIRFKSEDIIRTSSEAPIIPENVGEEQDGNF